MDKEKRSQLGWATVVALLLIGTALWILSKPGDFLFSDDPWKYLGQLAGILGTILLSLEYLLSTRIKILETVFGGLDRTYIAHRLIGGLGFALVLYHPLFLSLNSSIILNGLKLHFLPGGILSYNLGIIALYAYAVLIFLTVYVRLPYEVWRKTHTYMGVPLFVAAYHIMIIGSDLQKFLPLKIYMFTIVSIAIASYIYKLFLYGKISHHYEYKIEKISALGEITEISLVPENKPMQFIPGQFAFVKFNGGDVASELHPFSMSSAPGSEILRFSIKKLGDFTKSLINLSVGETVTLYGPHGEFGTKSLESNKPEIWIAGGIGITPFLSMLRYYGRQNSIKNITFFYCAKSANEFVYKNEIDELLPHLSETKVVYYDSDKNDHIDAKKIENLSDGLQGKKIFMCGPKLMMQTLAEAFELQKIHPRNIIFEDFSFLE